MCGYGSHVTNHVTNCDTTIYCTKKGGIKRGCPGMPHSRHVSTSMVCLHVTFLPVIQSIIFRVSRHQMEIKQTERVREPLISHLDRIYVGAGPGLEWVTVNYVKPSHCNLCGSYTLALYQSWSRSQSHSHVSSVGMSHQLRYSHWQNANQ